MSDPSEIWKALRTALTGDATLVAMLDSADQIWRQSPDGPMAYPAIVLHVADDNPQAQISGTGVWRPQLELHVFATDYDTCRAIVHRIDEQFTIPENRAEITSTNYRLTLLRRRNGIEVGTVRPIDSTQRIRQYTTEWHCRVNAR